MLMILSSFWDTLSRKKFMIIWRWRIFSSGRREAKGWVVHFEAMGAGFADCRHAGGRHPRFS